MASLGNQSPGDQTGSTEEKWELEMKATLDEGRSLMASRQYSKALHVLVEAVHLCPCNPAGGGKGLHGKEKGCNIAQCVAAVQSKDRDAVHRIAKDPCACGYRWPSCDRQLHAVGLDSLAECLFAAGQHVSAFSTALGTIRLNIASAVGYCRAAKILRSLLKEQSVFAVARSSAVILKHAHLASTDQLHGLLDCFVKSGIYNTGRYRRTALDSYDVVLQRMAHSLRLIESRRDPVSKLPREVLTMIFSCLDLTTLIQCLRVNKQWNLVVERDHLLWGDIRLARPLNPGRGLVPFLQKHSAIKSFVVWDASRFHLTSTKLSQLLYGLPQLKRLLLHAGTLYPAQQTLDFNAIPGRPAPGLTQLSLVSFDTRAPVRQLVQLTCGTLEVLDLVDTHGGINDIFESISFPRLRSLRIVEGYNLFARPQDEIPIIEMEPIVLATPRMEQFHLDGFAVAWRLKKPASVAKDGLWPSLRRVVFGANLHYSFVAEAHAPKWSSRLIPPLTANMRSIEILSSVADIALNVLFTTDQADPSAARSDLLDDDGQPVCPSLPNLEVFRCMAGLLGDCRYLRSLLEPAAAAGSLRVLDLAADPAVLLPPTGFLRYGRLDPAFRPAAALAFAASDQLHTLSLHSFNFFRHPQSPAGVLAPAAAASAAFDGTPFLDWLDCFPNLRTVGVYPGPWDGVAEFILRVIAHPRVKVVHQDVLRGVAWDEAVRFARLHGVRLHHTPRHMPVGWPMIED